VAAIDSCSATITFESLEHNEGFCIKYNGSGDIAISGKIRNRKLWNHKKNPHRYLMRILAILLLVSLLVMGWICADYYDSYILGNSYMTGSEESSAQSNERVLRSSAEELYYTSRWGIGIDIDIEEVKKSADEKARYELDVLQKRINYRIESGLLPGDSLADNNDNLRFSDNISAALIEVTIVVGLIIVLILFNPFRDPFSIQAWKKKLWKVINDDT
jgi:hypothetical protein